MSAGEIAYWVGGLLGGGTWAAAGFWAWHSVRQALEAHASEHASEDDSAALLAKGTAQVLAAHDGLARWANETLRDYGQRLEALEAQAVHRDKKP